MTAGYETSLQFKIAREVIYQALKTTFPNTTEEDAENATRSEVFLTIFGVFGVIYQTRVTVFHRDIQTPRREFAEYF